MAIDAQWSSVVLLLPLSSDLLDVKSHAVTAYGSAALSSAVGTPFGAGNALSLNGTTQYLQIPDSADFTLAAGDFTVEVWVRFVDHTSNLVIIGQRDGATSNHAFSVEYQTSNNLRFSYTTNGSTVINVDRSWTPSDGVWYHVSAIRSGTILQLKIDGVQIGADYTIGTDSIYNSTSTVKVGAINSTPAGFLNGYIGPLRLTRDDRTIVAAPTAPFPRPTISGTVLDHLAAPVARPVVAVDRKTSQVLSGTISDAITGAYTIYPRTFGEVTVARYDELFDPVTDECLFDLLPIYQRPGPSLVWGVVDTRSHIVSPVGNANFDLSITPFAGLPSISFDGSGDNVNSTSVDYALRTDDLSIEFWYRPINGGHGQAWSRIFQIGANNTNGTVACYCENTNSPSKLFVQFYSGSWITVVSSSAPLSNNTWHAIQIRRIAGVWTMYADEVLQGTSGSTSYDLTQTALYIGSNTTASESFYGNIGPFRIHKGPRRASQVTPLANFLKPLLDGGSGENAAIYDRVIPG